MDMLDKKVMNLEVCRYTVCGFCKFLKSKVFNGDDFLLFQVFVFG